MNSHPNWPRLADRNELSVYRGLCRAGIQGEYAVTLMLPHQGDYEWLAVFDESDADARVYLRNGQNEDADWRLTAATLGLFFWDLAQTGLAYYADPLTPKHDGAHRRVRVTDIGLALAK